MSIKKASSVSRRDFLKLAGTSVGGIVLAAAMPTVAQDVTPTATIPPTPLVDLLYLYPGTIQTDRLLVQDAMNEILRTRINATIRLNTIAYGDYEQRINLMNAAGEAYDLAFTASWINLYDINVSQGNFLAVDDLLQTVGRDVYASLPAGIWGAVRVGGQTYAVPNNNIMAFPGGFYVRKDHADNYGLDVTNINSYAETEAFLAAVKAGEGIAPIAANTDNPCGQLWSGPTGSDLVLGGPANAYTIMVDASGTVRSIAFDDAVFGNSVRLAHNWYLAGYYDTEIIPNEEEKALIRAGQKSIVYNVTTKPGAALEQKNDWGFDMYSHTIVPPTLTTGGVRATMTAIGANTISAEASMGYINEIHTNVELYNLLAKGIEGRHWVWDDQALKVIKFPDGVTAETSGYNPNSDWEFGDQFIAYYISPDQVGAWEETMRINSEAPVSAILGFSFNPEPVRTEIAQVQAVAGEVEVPLQRGMLDPETALPEFQANLRAAGIDTIVAEMQRQIDAWKQSGS